MAYQVSESRAKILSVIGFKDPVPFCESDPSGFVQAGLNLSRRYISLIFMSLGFKDIHTYHQHVVDEGTGDLWIDVTMLNIDIEPNLHGVLESASTEVGKHLGALFGHERKKEGDYTTAILMKYSETGTGVLVRRSPENNPMLTVIVKKRSAAGEKMGELVFPQGCDAWVAMAQFEIVNRLRHSTIEKRHLLDNALLDFNKAVRAEMQMGEILLATRSKGL